MNPANEVLVISNYIKDLELRITVNDDNITVSNLITGISESLSDKIRVFPVPARDFIVLRAIEGSFTDKKVRLRILDLSGRIVFTDESVELSGNPVTLNINHLKGGMYLIEITDNKISRRVKFVKMM
jgi:hypothetical protein